MMILSHGHELVENPEKGHATGAPKNPRIGKKMLMASIINAILTAIIVIIATMLDIRL